MKASLGKRRRSGNSAPAKRTPFPDVIQSTLDNALHSYTRRLGIKQAFNLYRYKNPQGQQAESSHSIAQLAPRLDALLTVNNSAKMKYKAPKQSFTFLLQDVLGCFSSIGGESPKVHPVGRRLSASSMKLMQQLWKG